MQLNDKSVKEEKKMKFSARITALVLALVFIMSAFAGCSLFGDSIYIATGKDIELSGEALSEYKLIRSASADSTIKNATASFLNEVKEITGITLGVSDDYIANTDDIPKVAKEIVIGTSNRPDGVALEERLSENEYIIAFKNRRIFIIGSSSEATLDALAYFRANHIDRTGKLIRINDMYEYKGDYTYPLKSVKINGVDIQNYKLIIPSSDNISEKSAANVLSDFFYANAGFKLTISTDNSAKSDYEILIGKTNRAESKYSVEPSFENMEYVFFKSGNKIVCGGESYLVGGGVSDLISRIPVDGKAAEVDITTIPTEAAVKKFEFKAAKSAILMIGDGMGFNTVEMSVPTIGAFIADSLPNKGNAYTGSLTTAENPSMATDSAAGGTALSTGEKTLNKYIGMDKDGTVLLNIRELADSKGANTGVISTDIITGATPATFLAHNDSRNDSVVLKAQINQLVYDRGVDWCYGEVGDELYENTALALGKLSSGGSSFFLMVEEGLIDKESHANNAEGCIEMVERFNETIAYAIQFVICHPDTVLIVTADHETGGIVKNDDGTFRYTLDDHSTVNVPVYALGYGTECFNGIEIDNTEIPKFMAKIFGESNFGE